MGMTHGEPAHLPASRWRDRLLPRPTRARRGGKGAHGAARLRRPHQPQARPAQVHHRRPRRRLVPAEVEQTPGLAARAGPRPFRFEHHGDRYGWTQGTDGLWHLTLCIESGRIRDWDDYPLMTGLRAIAARARRRFPPHGQSEPDHRQRAGRGSGRAIDQLVRQYKLATAARDSPLRRNALACVSLPTCPLGHGRVRALSAAASRQAGAAPGRRRPGRGGDRGPHHRLPQRLRPPVPGRDRPSWARRWASTTSTWAPISPASG